MQATPKPRVVLCGASNLARCLGAATQAARLRVGVPLELLIACGRGRSFVESSTFLGRRLPSIQDCGLWRALEHGPAPLAGFVGDVGNDLLYGHSPAVVASAVEGVLERLLARSATCVLASMPLANLERLSPAAFWLAQHLFFPTRRMGRPEVLARARELDQALRGMAQRRGVHLVELDPSWYAGDPIHIARAAGERAWSTLLATWPRVGVTCGSDERAPWISGWGALWARPAERSWWGIPQRRAQPALRFADGTELSLF